MENVGDMYETMLRVSEKADMLYEAYKKQEVDNAELKTLLHEEEEKQRLQLQLQATTQALEELKCNGGSIQIDHDALKTLLQEKEEKQRLQLQIQAATEALKEVKHNEGSQNSSLPISKLTSEVNSYDHSSVSSSRAIISIGNVEIPITGTDMRLLTRMGYKGGGLGIHGQGITHPLEVVQRPRYVGFGYTEGE